MPEYSRTEFLEAYRRVDRERRVLYSMIGSLLCIALVMAGSTLDRFVYPDLFGRILRVRILVSVITLAIFVMHFTDVGRRHIRLLGMAWIVLVPVAISWMIYISEGAISPYYAGLNLVVVAAAVILPWTFLETLFICSMTLASYVVACAFHRGTPIIWGIFYNNLFFLVATSIICVTTSRFAQRNRLEDFRLRYELDVRNREQAESYRQLAELDRLKSEFFANVSHELRTPITLIFGPIDRLLSDAGSLPAQTREMLSIARQNCLRLLKLINDLLELIRLESAQVDAGDEVTDLSALLPALADSVRHQAQSKGIELTAAAATGPALVHGDSWRLEKVFLNLLSNALKFTDRGGRVALRWRNDGERVLAEVEDTGVGIAAADLPFIFDRFRQVDGSSTRRHQGVGIGLALVREIVEKLGGEVTVSSRLGSGTTFRVEFPTASGDTAPTPVEEQAGQLDEVFTLAERSAGPATDQTGATLPILGEGEFTVLVVDDERDMRHFLSQTLAQHYRVLQAADGTTGLTLAREERPDLVLLDLMLPGMDGLAVCQAIKSDPVIASVKVVLLTARADDTTKMAALERKADDFLVKPFSTVEVMTRIANLLDNARLQSDLAARNSELERTLTQLRATEAQLVQSEKMRAVGTLAAGILHEINNPLNYSIMALQTASDMDPGDARLVECVADARDGMGRIRDIVSDLRTFASPSQGHTFMPFDLNRSVDAASRLTSHQTAGRIAERDVPEHCMVRGAEGQITQVLVNLLVNAAAALDDAPNGRPPQIRIWMEMRDGRAVLHVKDNGPGISADAMRHVTDPFFTTRPVGQGMGLGLSICHAIVENHGGKLTIESKEGEWTDVSFDLETTDSGR